LPVPFHMYISFLFVMAHQVSCCLFQRFMFHTCVERFGLFHMIFELQSFGICTFFTVCTYSVMTYLEKVQVLML
jgi:hypothetical protein